MRLIMVLALLSLMLDPQEPRSAGSSESELPQENVPIDYDGIVPGSQDPAFDGQINVTFSIYLTPTGGRPVWTERQALKANNGRISTKLGTTNPIPWRITVSNFKFASMRINDGPEILPRMPIVNVGFVQADGDFASESKAYSNSTKLDAEPRPAAAWAEAYHSAKVLGRRLPTYSEWYSSAFASALKDFSGHYEWTMPWVYDTSSHSDLNALFRGRYQGCDYMDLDPILNRYSFRTCQ